MSGFKFDLVKAKLLAIARTGVFVNFSPSKVDDTYNELKQLLINGDSIDIKDVYDLYELHVYLSLITNHDVEAKSYIDRIIDQFGDENSQRITLLKSIYYESQGSKKEGASILGANKNELRLSRRLLTYNRENLKGEEYVSNLVFYLNLQPADLIAWAELADEYAKLGHYDKSIFCLKEVLLEEPVAYPILYKVGLLNYYLFLQNFKEAIVKKDALVELMKYLVDSRNSWLRTIEVCKDHKASWLGVYLICNQSSFNDKLDKLANVKEFEKYKADIKRLSGPSAQKVMELNNITEKELKTLVL
ncbi:Inositol phosphatase SIW14 [Yamadazyma tenuis]|uniref:ER membrane protein complex subunit 2 n=1 Tax=Candida tenuis (strain ATCC 10573 / BCRC 21748 / CBS 615 / JCM 9827 / NBRC 10315 / NRRL Y-1498 / VKM Y-70) TaxID=590646 RepID=G3BDC9_CANTC|nr:uncharacterized protein CANTEDRAFT_128713 [Yamadazyma tenuis ATCC 10573]EGV60930.1 hypothetical protein CANTEDRAFT_128713 [Yamadazyma tenuis ATCC 10573]WEJ93796.1 Inositol phosphatase SIW14 [Yamadazyma tenuis]